MKLSVTIRLTLALFCAAWLQILAPIPLAAQSRIEGQVLNGTTGRPVSNQEVRLLLPRGGMQQVAAVSTDTDGRFQFAQRGIDPSSFYLLETRFQEVAYHAPPQFDPTGIAKVTLTVYNSTQSDSALRIQLLRILLRAEGTKLRAREEYSILNASDPARTFAIAGGTFYFHLSPQATEPRVAVTGLMNMELPQTPEPGKSPGEFFIRYPLKPGITTVTVAYDADYSSREFGLSDRVSYPIEQAEIYASPSSLSVQSPAFKPAGTSPTNDIQKLEARNLTRGSTLEVQITGDGAASAPTETQVRVDPNSMTRMAAPLLACFLLILIWALGIRVAKEWPQWRERHSRSPAHQQLEAKAEGLFNSIADLDELFASGKIAENKYWKERLDLKARLAAVLKKAPPSLRESYATRHTRS